MAKIYKITSEQFGLDWSAKFEISDEIKHDLIKESFNFFSGGKQILAKIGDKDLVGEYLKYIGASLIEISYRNGGYVSEVIKAWDNTTEGYLLLDGSDGIKLIDIDQEEFDEDFSVEVVG